MKPACNVIKQVRSKSNYFETFSNLQIYHQNIRGIHNKLDELLIQCETKIPQIFCFMEHRLSTAEILRTSINQYNLGAYFYRKSRKNGGVRIFVQQNLQYTPIDLEEFCLDQEIEVCAIKVHHSTNIICILMIYRAPLGNFVHFLNTLGVILNKIHTNFTNIILCGDINKLFG
jgi:exonuclease III